jgi:N-methylhydantoinase B/oxoprolinase/acetone carboxylase alpha subunit
MQGDGEGDMCNPVKANPVVPWSNVAVVKFTVVWQALQFAAANVAPAEACGGALVCCQVVKWHPEFPQSVGAIVKA